MMSLGTNLRTNLGLEEHEAAELRVPPLQPSVDEELLLNSSAPAGGSAVGDRAGGDGEQGRMASESAEASQHELDAAARLVDDVVCFFTTRDVKAGEELTFKYHRAVYAPSVEPRTCLCGAAQCRGVY
jgi:hypothetical protein